MNHVSYFEDLFESVQDCREVVLKMFLIKNDKKLLVECRYSKVDNSRLGVEF